MEQDNKRSCIQDTDIPDLEALKGALEHREALKIKAERIRETALSRIKAREKASRRQINRSNEKTPDESSTATPPSGGSGRKLSATNTAAKEKSDQLKRKLEEARAKVESMRGQENLGKVNEVVESIRVQIEDREKVLQEMLTIHSAKTAVEPEVTMDMEPAIPDEIKQKIADLEAQVLDLQENLKEKDSVIAARTQAITLLSEDMSRKSKERIDNLEETQEQMRQMQRNFILIEERMREEQHKLAQQAEERKQRCVQAEKNLRQAESARFDLSTRVAELQEKVVALQEKNIELEKNATESQQKQDEMKESLDAANKLTIKMKAQFKAKMKTLEEERDTLKRMSESGEELSRLQNRIAELEEEKGNLQLSLLDFDEQQELCNMLKSRIEELESKTKHQDEDLDSHVKLISQLEKEKLDLIHGTQQYNAMLKEKDTLIDRLQQQLAELNRLKVSAEMRAVELEEKLDLGIREQRRAEDEDQGMLENMRNELVKYEETVRELQEKLSSVGSSETSEKDDVIRKLTTEVDEWKLKYFEMETQYNSMVEVYRSLEGRVAVSEAHNENVVKECEQLRLVISELESSVVRMNDSNEISVKQVEVNEEASSELRSPVSEEVVAVQGVVSNVESTRQDERDFEIERLRYELQAASEELHRLNSLVEDFNSSNGKLNELNMKINEKDRELQDTCNELEKRSRKLSEYKKFHKLKSEDVIRVSHELETVTSTSQEKIAKLEEDLAKSRETISELQKQLEGGSSSGGQNMEQKMKKLAANLKLKVKAIKEFEAKIAQMEGDLESKSQEIKRVSDERNDVVRCMEEKQNAIEDLSSANKKLTVELSELRNSVAEFKSQASGNSEVANRLDAAARIESDYVRVSEMLKQKQIEVEQLRGELCAAKEEIHGVFSRLQETTMRSEQADVKLQEKEMYIESLESELNKARDRVQSIESSVEERRRSLEEKAESLGIRLLQAESANEEFERQGGELERQLAYLAENENYLQTGLINMRNENDGLRRTVDDLNAQINVFLKDLENNRNTITHLQKELGAAREVQEAYNQNIEELDRLNTANKQLKAGKEKLVVEFEEREKQMLENVEEEMKCLNERVISVENERQELYRKLEEMDNEMGVLRQEADMKKVLLVQLEDLEQQRVALERRCEEANSKVSLYEDRLQTGHNRSDVEEIMAEQKQLMENLKVEFENRESNYLTQIRELQDYNTELLRSLEAIERNAGNLKTELSRVGLELAASKEELIAMRADQDKSTNLQAKLVELKENYEELLTKEQNAAASLKELLREKAKKEVEDVVSEAENRASLISQQQTLQYEQQEHQVLQYQQIQQEQQQEQLHYQQQIQQKPMPTLFTFPTTNDPVDDPFSKVEPVASVACAPPSISSFFQQPVQPSPSESNDQLISELKAKLMSALEENQRLSSLVGAASNVMETVGDVNVAQSVVTSSAAGRHLESKDEEDGWGWGGDESMMEQSPVKKIDSLVSGDQRVTELERRLQDYQNDNRRLADELKESNLKCAKLLKKAKELKAKSEHLEKGSRQQSVGFEDLDFAMQEELREKIGVLEKSLQEAKGEAKSWKAEKENLTRRVETLTSGNERLVEMKERQDVEVAMWQKQNAELKHRIQGLEWKIEELSDETHQQFTQESSSSTPDVEQLKDKLNSLAAENEQLMKVLNEMKDQNLQQGTDRSQPNVVSEESQHLRQQIDNLQKLYNQAQMDLEELTRHNASILNANESINGRFDSFKVEIDQLAAENEKLRGELAKIEDISSKYSSFSAEFEQLKNENNRIELLEEENRLMKDIVSTAEEQLKMYKNKLNDNEKNLVKIDENYANLKREFDRLLGINDENSELLEKLRLENCDLRNEADEYKKSLEEALKKESNAAVVTENVVEKNVEPVTNRQFAPVLFEGFKNDDNAESNDPFSFSTLKDCQEEASSSNPSSVSPEQTELVDEIVKTNQLEQDEEDLKELKEEVCNLNTLLDEKEDELEITLQSVDSIRLERENLEDEWNEKFKKLKTKNSSATVVKAEAFRDQLNIARKKFQNELLLKEEEIAHLTCELSAKEQLLMNSVNELDNVQVEAEKALIKLREVEGELENRTSDFDKLRHEMDCLRGEYSSLQRALDEKARYIEELELSRQDAEVCKEQLLRVKSELKEALSGNEVLREKRSNVDDSFYDLEYDLRKELEEKTASLTALKAKYEELEKRSEKDVILSEWERIVSEKDVKLSELERIVYEKDVELSDWGRIASEKDVRLSELERILYEKDVKLSEWERFASEKDVKLSEWERFSGEKDVKLLELERLSNEKDMKLSSLEQSYTECYDLLQKNQNTVMSLEENLRQVQATKQESVADNPPQSPVENAQKRENLGDDENWKEYLMAEVERCREMISKRDAEIVRLKKALLETQDALTQANDAVYSSSYSTVHSFKQRLDEALYTLHVRDLRCEELTHELLQLLAERDELQLRLSASIKMNETSREKMEKSPAKAITAGSEQASSAADQSASAQSNVQVTPQVYVLNEKLGELQQTDYRKDLSVHRDREKRYIEQQHLYSNAPPEEHEHESNPSFFGWLFGASK